MSSPASLDASRCTAHIGGQTATFGDLSQRVNDRLPYFIAAVVLLSFVLLTMVFRSVVVALKAALLNLLSIGAAYGVIVMVFQWGWGKSLIGLESTVPIVVFIPLFMFAILFGLSMDYEVFLLSRVREEYLRTGDNDAAVIHGIASTARVITSAALIMISVFLGFVLGSDPTTKMFGLGLATAIFVDATIVRMVLVPATMKLMGRANWWLPTWLDRLLPAIDIEGESGLPAPEMRADEARTTAGRAETTGSRPMSDMIDHHAVSVQLDIDYPDRPLNRLTSGFRLVTAIPVLALLALFDAGRSTGLVTLPVAPMHVRASEVPALVVRLEPATRSLRDTRLRVSAATRRSLPGNRRGTGRASQRRLTPT